MAPPILTLRDIHLTFGGTPLLEGTEFSVSEGDRLSLVGRNGSGKSTLLKIVAGMVDADSGERFVQPGCTVRYLPQEPDFSGFTTTLAYVEAGLGPGDDPYRAHYLLEQLDLSGTEDPATLSGGEARRCALARVLAPQPDILLLDEPTNHLDLPAIEWLEAELKSIRSALVIISHDRRFLENLTRATVWLSLGRTRRLEKGFKYFEAWRDELIEQEELDRHKLDRKLVAETSWLHKGVSARRKRNQGRLRALFALRDERQKQRTLRGAVKLSASEAESSGKRVIEAFGIAKAFDENHVVREFSTRIVRGDRVGIIGPNGAGKTTLLSMLTGALAPDSGSIKLGTNLEMVSLDQRRESLDPNTALADALTGGHGDSVSVGGELRHVIGYMKDFLFSPDQARTALSALSGGERGRVMLARALARPSNLLVLDEPTNDLDLETLDLLQETLTDYPGTVLIVSHDRDFLDLVATSVIAYEGDGNWREYVGGYADMLHQRGTDVTSKSAEKPGTKPRKGKQATASQSGKSPGKGRLTFKDKHALDTLPARMDALHGEIEGFQVTLAAPNLFTRDPDAFEAAASGMQRAQTDLAEAEEQWLELEMKREDVEG